MGFVPVQTGSKQGHQTENTGILDRKKIYLRIAECTSKKKNWKGKGGSIIKYACQVFSPSQKAFKFFFFQLMTFPDDFVPIQTGSKQGLRLGRERISRNFGTGIQI